MIESMKYICYGLGIALTDATCSFLYIVSLAVLPFAKALVSKIFRKSDIHVNGGHPSDPKVLDVRFYGLVAKHSYTGLVDAYANGYFECSDLTELFEKVYGSKYYNVMCYHPSIMWRSFFTRHFFIQTKQESIGESYDKSSWSKQKNDKKCETLSTGYWKSAVTCEDAVKAKHDLIARKLKLKPGMRVLDIGCGEGAFCRYLSENHKVEVTGVNVSKASIIKAKKFSRGLKITYKVMDARRINGVYDRITCIGMIEHLGATELRRFFKRVHRCLANDGLFLLEAYNVNHQFAPINSGYSERVFNLHAVNHYYLDVLGAVDELFVIEDCQNLRNHFRLTTKNWLNELNVTSEDTVSKDNRESIRATKAAFADATAFSSSGQLQVYQFVLSKNGIKSGYETVV